jgi:RHS repeat-associated protein
VFSTVNGQQASSDLFWQLSDQQGTVRDIANTGGVLRKHVNYDAFGTITGEQYYDNGGNPIVDNHAQAIDQLFYYTGQEWNADAELYNYNARWYDPTIGRFYSEDPSGLEPDPNPYRYVGNDPVNHTEIDHAANGEPAHLNLTLEESCLVKGENVANWPKIESIQMYIKLLHCSSCDTLAFVP